MKYKNIVWVFIGTSFVVSLLFFSVIYYYDPLKLFHKPWQYKTYLQSNMRVQAAGMLRHWEYDSIILGTSVLENTSSKEASTLLDGNFINISMAGSDYFERSIVLNYALQKKKIKTVLYSMDNLGTIRKGDTHYPIKQWDYLYDSNMANDIQIYLNNRYLTCLFSFEDKSRCMGSKVDLDRPKSWYKVKEHIATFGGFDHWIAHRNQANMKHALYLITKSLKEIEKSKHSTNQQRIIAGLTRSKQYLNHCIVGYVQKYPKTEFIAIIPPYSRLVYALEAQKDIDSFAVYLQSIKYLVRVSKKYPNLKIYAWGNHAFLDDLANYRDLTHFSEKINSWMLHAIQKKEGLLTIQNIDTYLDVFMKKALAYDFTEIAKKIATK
ncbi:MAG: hypothetical protein DSZ09_02180 [Sulfurovum sp.]|nr:MAG: hypothetical protein DSZ09_02180 [Sulfurovum sp.]